MIELIGAKTDFSLGESIYSAKALVKDAAEAGYTSLAIADRGTVNGLVTCFNAAKDAGIKLVFGAQLRVSEDPTYRKPKKGSGDPIRDIRFFDAKVYVRNEAGVRDLMALLTVGNRPDNYMSAFKVEDSGPQVSVEDLCKTLGQGNVTVTTGDLYSLFRLHPDYVDAQLALMMAAARDSSQIVAEATAIDTLYHDAVNERTILKAREKRLPLCVSRPVWYPAGKPDARDVMNANLNGDKISGRFFQKPVVRDLYVKPLNEYQREVALLVRRLMERGAVTENPRGLYNDLMAGNKALVDACSYEWAKLEPCLPSMDSNPDKALVELCAQGFKDRLMHPVLGYQPDSALLPEYKERLKYELGVLRTMGFSDYFLLVRYIVNWSRSNGIMVGPGRGSVGGSLVAFLIGITDVDPIRFGLFFERFINPERIDLPDVDLDFMSSRRNEIIDHLKDRFGEEYVATISNYAALASSSSLRRVGKVYQVPDYEMDCAKFVPKEHGQPVKLEEAVKQVPEIEKYALAHPDAFNVACQLQGTFTNLAQHAAGVVVAGEPVGNRCVVEHRSGQNICNWDKRVIEDWGLVKLDVLGLSNLDMLKLAADMVRDKGQSVDYESIPLDDGAVLEQFAAGNTIGVFQFESPGMQKLLKNMAQGGDLSFEDVAAATALYRPGPIDAGLMEMFVGIRQGAMTPLYPHPLTEPALKETYSVIVYQEQVMQVARDLAGFTMAESDKLRKAMGKKLPEEMAKFREKFVKGCIENAGMTDFAATELFDQIEKFAGYGFNKSHSVEYSIISFWTMWLKVYHPTEFYAAALTILPEEKHAKLAKDALANGVHVVPPDVNKSGTHYRPGYDAKRGVNVLYAPFQSVKGCSEKGAAKIMEARERRREEKGDSNFTSKEDFIDMVERRIVNKRVQEALDKVGAFASIEPGQLPARHPDRLKDQKALLGGVVVQDVSVDRKIGMSEFVKSELLTMQEDIQKCEGCDLKGKVHPLPAHGQNPTFVMVFDAPNYFDEQGGRMLHGKGGDPVKRALKHVSLKPSDGYYTALVRAQKDKGTKLSNEQINGCSGFLEKELELLKPAVIIAMGGAAIRHFVPDVKGGWEELVGQTHYDAKRDATIVFGMNPGQVAFDPGKQKHLDNVMEIVADLMN